MLADPPNNPPERLAELQAYEVLDTDPEQRFDDVVDLVAKICDTPIALISLVDKDRQWFKARHGLDASETDLDRSICSHAILQEDLLEIADTLADDRTADNPLCLATSNPVRFYAGASLVTPNGHKLGTLCVLDYKPRTLTALQRKALRVMAGQVMQQLELRRSLVNEGILRDEIDHRVKNSLQTVMSFIRLYANQSRAPETRDALDAIVRRVSAIAQLHSELYQTNEFDRIGLDRYLQRVLDLLTGTMGANITASADFAPMRVDSRTAATLAMIVSEFCANAIKHAFPNDRSGQIIISLEPIEPDGLRLVCQDNGVGNSGRAPGTQPDSASVGTRLMETAAEQIGGDMTLTAGPEGYVLTLIRLPRSQLPTEIQADAP